jgi:hypothetical protein
LSQDSFRHKTVALAQRDADLLVAPLPLGQSNTAPSTYVPMTSRYTGGV